MSDVSSITDSKRAVPGWLGGHEKMTRKKQMIALHGQVGGLKKGTNDSVARTICVTAMIVGKLFRVTGKESWRCQSANRSNFNYFVLWRLSWALWRERKKHIIISSHGQTAVWK